MTRQTAKNHALRAEGKCIRCRKESPTLRCPACLAIKRQQERERFGTPPWRAGKPGRHSEEEIAIGRALLRFLNALEKCPLANR